MILEVLLVLIGAGILASAGMALKIAPLYSSMMSMAIWLVVGYASTSIDLTTDAGGLEEGVASEPALSVLAFGNAMLSLIIVVAASTGSYGADDEHGTDRPFTEHEVFDQ